MIISDTVINNNLIFPVIKDFVQLYPTNKIFSRYKAKYLLPLVPLFLS